jgi:hypothetical protein
VGKTETIRCRTHMRAATSAPHRRVSGVRRKRQSLNPGCPEVPLARCDNFLVSGSNWVALAGIASGVLVTALSLWYGSRLQAERERLGELRNVLDLAGGAISEAIVAGRRRVVAKGAAVEETGESFEDKHGAVRVFESRIAIRLGNDDPLTQAYHLVEAQLEEVGKKLFGARGELAEDAQKSTNKDISRVRELQLAYLASARAVVNPDNRRQGRPLLGRWFNARRSGRRV